jgi:hypothetical protein
LPGHLKIQFKDTSLIQNHIEKRLSEYRWADRVLISDKMELEGLSIGRYVFGAKRHGKKFFERYQGECGCDCDSSFFKNSPKILKPLILLNGFDSEKKCLFFALD